MMPQAGCGLEIIPGAAWRGNCLITAKAEARNEFFAGEAGRKQ